MEPHLFPLTKAVEEGTMSARGEIYVAYVAFTCSFVRSNLTF